MNKGNDKHRIESFSDDILSIIITIMLFNIHPFELLNIQSLTVFIQSIIAYFASFILIITFWDFHRQLFSELSEIHSLVVGINSGFLFSVSLIPFATQEVAKYPSGIFAESCYAFIYLITNSLFLVLFEAVVKTNLNNVNKDEKNYAKKMLNQQKNSVILSIFGLVISFVFPVGTILFFIMLPVIRLIFRTFILKKW